MPNDQKIIVFNSIVFGLVGIAFLFFPEAMAELITDGTPSSPSGLIDMRATYGGALLGFGVVLHLLAIRPGTRRQGLQALIAVLGGMAIGRVVGILIDGPANSIMYLFLAYELVFVILSVIVLSRTAAE